LPAYRDAYRGSEWWGTFSRNENGIKHKGKKFTPVYVHNALVLFAQSLIRFLKVPKF
jgi:hypothetical protein